MAVSSGEDRPHEGAAILEVPVFDGLFGESVTVCELREVGERNFFRLREVLERSLQIAEAVRTNRRGERSRLIAFKQVAKANYRSAVIDLELNTQLKMRVLRQRACKEILGRAIVEMGWSFNGSEMMHYGRNLLSIDRKSWRSELVSATALGCSILPKTALSAGKGNPHLPVLDIGSCARSSLSHAVQRNGQEC